MIVVFFQPFRPSDVTRGQSSVYVHTRYGLGIGLGLVPSIVKNTMMSDTPPVRLRSVAPLFACDCARNRMVSYAARSKSPKVLL